MSYPLREIGKKHLNFEIRNPKTATSLVKVIQQQTGDVKDYKICGEDVLIMALAESDDGTVHHANLTDPCKYIAMSPQVIASPVAIQRDGKIQIPNAGFALNKPVYLCNLTPGTPVIPNLTTTPPTPVNGEVFQIIGHSPGHPTDLTTDWMYIKIEEPSWWVL